MSTINGYPVKITGIGSALPETIINNDDLSKIVETNDEWVTSRTGIKERRVVSGNESLTDLSVIAAKEALAYAGTSAEDIDLIISATSIPDNLYPSTACEVQGKIGAVKAAAFNVVAACSGFVFAMQVAQSMIAVGTYKKALVIGGDLHSRAIDWSDRNTCILFGDAAGAMVLEKSDDESDILNIELNSDGTKGCDLYIPLNGKNSPLAKKNDVQNQHVAMNGKEIFKFSVRVIPEAVRNALNSINMTTEDIDYLIPHQANIRIIEALGEKLNLREDQLIAKLQYFGNTSAASIPLALDYALRNKKISKLPAKIAMVGFGSGLTWGVAVINFRAEDKRKA